MFLKIIDSWCKHLQPDPKEFSHAERRELKGDRHILRFEKEHGFLSPRHPLVGRTTESKRDIDIVCRVLDKLSSDLASSELLVKALAYRSLEEGVELPFQGKIFQVNRVFRLWGGIPAFGLLAEDLSESILLFRGTDFSLIASKRVLASLLADCDPRGAGFSIFRKARPELRLWLQRMPSPRAMGFSLGGMLASYVALYERKWLAASPSFALNPPGVYRPIYRVWKQAKGKGTPPCHLNTYVTQGDWVSGVGDLIGHVHHMGGSTVFGPIQAHTYLITGAESYWIAKPLEGVVTR